MNTVLTPIRSSSPLPLRLRSSDNFACLQSSVRRRLRGQFGALISGALFDRAVSEAVQAAEGTGFPHLFFPVLAEEQVQRIARLADEMHPEAASSRFRSAA